MITISEILKELEPYTGRFPMKAMRTAVAQREAITPELLRVVEAVAHLSTDVDTRSLPESEAQARRQLETVSS